MIEQFTQKAIKVIMLALEEARRLGIKELLTQLKAAIEADSELDSDDKNEVLEQVLILAAGQNFTQKRMQKFAKTALKILKATVAELPPTNKLVEECNQLLPAIARIFGLR